MPSDLENRAPSARPNVPAGGSDPSLDFAALVEALQQRRKPMAMILAGVFSLAGGHATGMADYLGPDLLAGLALLIGGMAGHWFPNLMGGANVMDLAREAISLREEIEAASADLAADLSGQAGDAAGPAGSGPAP